MYYILNLLSNFSRVHADFHQQRNAAFYPINVSTRILSQHISRMNMISKSKKDKRGCVRSCNDVRERRLMKELKDVTTNADSAFTVDLVEDNLFEWHVSSYYFVDTTTSFIC